MSYKRSRLARSWLRSFLSFVFSKCGRCISRKIIPFCLCFVVLGLSLSVPSFAASDGFNAQDLEYSGFRWTISGSSITETDITSSVTVTSDSALGEPTINYILPNGPSDTQLQGLIAFKTHSLKASHEYNLQFGYAMGHTGVSSFQVLLVFYDGLDNVIRSQEILNVPNGITPAAINYVDVNFVPDTQNLSSGYRCELQFKFLSGTLYTNTCRLTQQITLIDTDDNTGLLDSILNWLSRIYHSIAGGTDREGVNHTGIVQGITNGLTNLGNRISTFFADLKQGFLDKLESVKTSITNAIDGIEQWFIDLKDNIVDGLKSLFIPRDGYFAEKKTQLETFATQHFGALYQGPDVMIDLIRKLLTVDPSANPGITMPAIEFDFQGQHYTLTEPIHYSFSWVNDSSHPLYYFYHIYRGFVTVILFVGFGNYLVKKYRDVFEGGGDGE